MTDQERIAAARARTTAAAHAMQSGVAAEMNAGMPAATEPKHLRVGVNMALIDSAAIARLLIRKGIITEVELAEALADQTEEEKRSYERRLSEHYRRPVSLA